MPAYSCGPALPSGAGIGFCSICTHHSLALGSSEVYIIICCTPLTAFSISLSILAWSVSPLFAWNSARAARVGAAFFHAARHDRTLPDVLVQLLALDARKYLRLPQKLAVKRAQLRGARRRSHNNVDWVMHRALGYSSAAEAKTASSPGSANLGVDRPRILKPASPLAPIGRVRPPRGKLPPLSEGVAALTDDQIDLARLKFAEYDKDHSSTIDKAELYALFNDLHLDMTKSVLDIYVRKVFNEHDKDLSGALECVLSGITRYRCDRLLPAGVAWLCPGAAHPQRNRPPRPRSFDEFLGIYGILIRETRRQGFSFAEWKAHKQAAGAGGRGDGGGK